MAESKVHWGWQLGRSVAFGAVVFFLQRVLYSWGILEPAARTVGGWLAVNISPSLAAWCVALLIGVALLVALHLWPLRKTRPVEETPDTPMEIVFDPDNPGKKFWSQERLWSEKEDRYILIWEYRIEVRNNSPKTLRNVSVTTEHIGKLMPVRPYRQEFDNLKSKSCDVKPFTSQLAPIVKWSIPIIQEGMLADKGALEYGPIQVTVSADDTPPVTRIFQFDYQRTPMVFD